MIKLMHISLPRENCTCSQTWEQWEQWCTYVQWPSFTILNGNTVALIVLIPEHSPTNTLRNNDVVITSKRHFDGIASKWRRFDVISTLLLRHFFQGCPAYNVIGVLVDCLSPKVARSTLSMALAMWKGEVCVFFVLNFDYLCKIDVE